MSNYEILSQSDLEIKLNREYPSPLWKLSEGLETDSVEPQEIPLPIKPI